MFGTDRILSVCTYIHILFHIPNVLFSMKQHLTHPQVVQSLSRLLSRKKLASLKYTQWSLTKRKRKNIVTN